MDQLLYDLLEEATLRDIRAQFWDDHRQQKQHRKDAEAAALGRAARAWTNTQKYVDERYAAKALAQTAAQHWINDKNQDNAEDSMEKDEKLCSRDPAIQDKSAPALLPEEATLREVAAQPEETHKQQWQDRKDGEASNHKPQEDDSEPAPTTCQSEA